MNFGIPDFVIKTRNQRCSISVSTTVTVMLQSWTEAKDFTSTMHQARLPLCFSGKHHGGNSQQAFDQKSCLIDGFDRR